LLLMVLGVGLFAANLAVDHLLGAPRQEAEWVEARLNFRWWLLAIALLTGAFGFWDARDNMFRIPGVIAWFVSVTAWLLSVWEGHTPPMERLGQLWARAVTVVQGPSFNVRLTRVMVLVGLVLVIGSYFRFSQLASIPPEMTSDHVEKLFDVHDLVDNAKHWVYFERNTGRELIQFYFAAAIIYFFQTGFTHLTLKITSSVASFLMLPTMFFLGWELEDKRFGLLAMSMAAVSFWATAIGRVGLRFPLTPLFVAPALLFLLRG